MLFFDIQGIAISEQLSLESSKPNVIVILTDDQGYADLGVYGSADLRTPNIDQIAQRGTRLLNFYAQPSCGPSRAALLPGSYPILVGEPSNKKNPNTILHEKEITNAIDKLSTTKTILIVAHRLSTVRNCDKIIFMRDGRIESAGDYATLIKTSKDFRRFASMSNDVPLDKPE